MRMIDADTFIVADYDASGGPCFMSYEVVLDNGPAHASLRKVFHALNSSNGGAAGSGFAFNNSSLVVGFRADNTEGSVAGSVGVYDASLILPN